MEMSARCGVRAARVAHAASTKCTEKGEGNQGNRKGIHVGAEKEIVTIERTKRGSRMQLVKGIEKGEGNRDCSRDARAAQAAL